MESHQKRGPHKHTHTQANTHNFMHTNARQSMAADCVCILEKSGIEGSTLVYKGKWIWVQVTYTKTIQVFVSLFVSLSPSQPPPPHRHTNASTDIHAHTHTQMDTPTQTHRDTHTHALYAQWDHIHNFDLSSNCNWMIECMALSVFRNFAGVLCAAVLEEREQIRE